MGSRELVSAAEILVLSKIWDRSFVAIKGEKRETESRRDTHSPVGRKRRYASLEMDVIKDAAYKLCD